MARLHQRRGRAHRRRQLSSATGGVRAAFAEVCATFDTYGIAHDDKPPPRRAAADVFQVPPSSEELASSNPPVTKTRIPWAKP